MSNKIALHPDSQLALLYCAVKGIETHSEEKESTLNGDEKQVTREVTTTIKDVHEAKEAKKLRNALAAIFRKYVTTIGLRNKFTISTTAQLDAYRADAETTLAQIADFNARAVHHPVEVELTPIPLATALAPETVQGIYTELANRLDALKTHFERGNTAAIAAWFQRNRSIGTFLPSAVQGVVDDGLAQAKEALATLRERCDKRRHGDQAEDPGAVGAELAQGLFALDTARGLVNPSNPQNTGATLSLVGAA